MAAITGISESCVAAVTRTRWCRDMKLHLANLLHLVSSLLILRLGYIKLINILSLQRWEHNWWWHLQNIWIRNLQQLPTWYNRGNITNLIHEFQLQEWILSEVDTKCCAPLPLPAGGIQIRLLHIVYLGDLTNNLYYLHIQILLFQDCHLSFRAASVILSSFDLGGFDTIYVHVLDTHLCGE